MNVRRLGIDEGARLRAIRLRALQEAPDAFGSTFEEAVARPPASWREQLEKLPTFVATRGDDDVGVVRCALDERGDTASLISMWVAPEVRGAGVGATLIDAVIACARSSGAKRLRLDVAEGNARAIALYRRKGFLPNGETSVFPAPREHIRECQFELSLDASGV